MTGSSIMDVAGVRVSHVNVRDAANKLYTGVTCIASGSEHPFRVKHRAGCHVINGFGKSLGLMQVAELGTLETPILLTNTLSVGTCFTACARYMMGITPEIGESAGTVNPVVFECNDGVVNDLRALGVTEEHALSAIGKAYGGVLDAPLLGSQGAGSGMVTYGLKGGIGSCSAMVEVGGKEYTLGCLVLTNFGSMRTLTVRGDSIGERLCGIVPKPVKTDRVECDKGSVIVIYATDAPMSSRQLTRVCKRAQNGVARTGTFTGNGSGEIALAFTTANRVPHTDAHGVNTITELHESKMDLFFEAAVTTCEDAILSSLMNNESVGARHGGMIYSYHDAINIIGMR
ncbi:MAG: P1 family peptidase [Oscillospiraceae bacterium]|jgi:D-aminopeptidase|nr:P1 family peptidase [Oscillospiraceae bacterium]